MPLDPFASYAFRYRDPLTGRWIRSPQPAPLDSIAERFDEWQVIGIATAVNGGGQDGEPSTAASHARTRWSGPARVWILDAQPELRAEPVARGKGHRKAA